MWHLVQLFPVSYRWGPFPASVHESSQAVRKEVLNRTCMVGAGSRAVSGRARRWGLCLHSDHLARLLMPADGMHTDPTAPWALNVITLTTYTSDLGPLGPGEILSTLLSWREFDLSMSLDFNSQQSRQE